MHDSNNHILMADSGQEYSFHIKTAYEHLEEAERSYKESQIELENFHRHLRLAGEYAHKINLRA